MSVSGLDSSSLTVPVFERSATPAPSEASRTKGSVAEFHEELRTRNQALLAWSAIIFNSIYVLWIAFDLLLAPEHWRQFLALRVGASGLNTALVLASRHPKLRRYTFEAFWLWLFIFGAFVAPMLVQVEATFVGYVLGFGIVLFGAGIVPLWPPRWTVTNVLAQVSVVTVTFAWFPPSAQPRDLVAGAFFALTCALMSSVLASSKYYLLKRHYFTQMELRNVQLVTERLREADRLKDEFLANVSHELRTPLNGIIGLSESMLDGGSGKLGSAQANNLAMIASSGRRLANLVNDLLDFSKLRNHDVQLTQRSTDLKQNVEVVLALLAPLCEGKDLKLINALDESLPPAHADENRLQQILFNLLGNAIKFSERGSVRVSARVENDKIFLTVTDTGIGIPPEKFDLIFESFEQGEASISRTYGGTGLGLAVTKKLVELHGGSISVESEVGTGSAFTFSLPVGMPLEGDPFADARDRLLRRVGPWSAANPASATPLPRAENSESLPEVLVVDDEPINLHVVANMLTVEGYRVTEARSGAEALQKLENATKPALILLDVMMPKMSGFEVLRRLRQKSSAAELPVILLTSKNQVSDLVQGFESGANDYVTKPIAKGELLSRIRAHLSTSRMCEAYGRFVPHQFLRHLDRESILDVNLGDQVQKEMAILFSDIRAFTTLSEEMSPAENFNFLNSFLRRVAPVVAQHGGFIDQYIGDAVMALFPGSADDAIQAAIQLRGAVRLYNEHRGMSGYRPIRLGTGLHAGPLILGTIGYEQRLQTTVVSDSVNLASRLEGLTKQFNIEVAVSEEMLSRLKDPGRFNLRTLGRMRVKGKRRQVHVYELLDGAPDEELQLRLSTREHFERGVMHVLEQQYSQAASCFQEVTQADPGDLAAEYLLKRARDLEKNPAPDFDRRSSE